MNPAIVVSAYNRPQALARLLKSLQNAEYPADLLIPLIISIDQAGSSPDVLEVAQSFQWSRGTKQLILHPEPLGLVNHFLSCGNLSQDLGGIIYLEDDLVVSPVFYAYASQAISFFCEDSRIGGISLYALWFNGYTQEPFTPWADEADHFFVQVPYTQGQVFTKAQWSSFQNWMDTEKMQPTNSAGLHKVWSRFREDEWFPLMARYLVATNRYYVFPRVSLTTGFGDAGSHFDETTSFFQTPLQQEKNCFKFKVLDESFAVYDSFFEMLSDRLFRLVPTLEQYLFTMDLYATRSLENFSTEYALSTRPCRHAILSYGKVMRPLEANIVNVIPGKDIFLCRVEDLLWDKWTEFILRKRNYDYFTRNRHLGMRKAIIYTLIDLWEKGR